MRGTVPELTGGAEGALAFPSPKITESEQRLQLSRSNREQNRNEMQKPSHADPPRHPAGRRTPGPARPAFRL